MSNKLTFVKTICLIAFSAVCTYPQQPSTSSKKWEPEIKKLEESNRQNPAATGGVLFIGSSSIRLWKDLAEAFPSTMVINRGFGGSEIADSTYYVDRIVTPYQPRMILLYAGDNDIANGKTPHRVLEDYQEFVARVRRKLPTARIAFISIKPSPARWHLINDIRSANEMIRRYAAHEKNLIYIDVFTPMLSSDGKPRQELFVEDGLHLNKEGYRLWRSVIAPHIH